MLTASDKTRGRSHRSGLSAFALVLQGGWRLRAHDPYLRPRDLTLGVLDPNAEASGLSLVQGPDPLSDFPLCAIRSDYDVPMTFQAYIDNIHKKTGLTPDDFKRLAEKKGLLQAGVKTMEIVAWLKRDHALGHGHAMAIVATLKGRKV